VTAAVPTAAGLPAGRVALALALLLGLQPVTTDLYLPALPLLTRDLSASLAAAQLTMSALILAFGLGQLVCGPLADRVGRRPVLMVGLGVYTAASVASALAGTVEWLVSWRVLQGLGLAAAVVCARATVRDLYLPHQGAQVMSLALSGLGVIAVLAPAVGGAVAAEGGWRLALALVAAAGALSWAYVAWQLPETAPQLDPHATRLGPLLRRWGGIARNPTFVAWTLLISCTYGGLFTLLAGSSFIFIDGLGLSPASYGLALASGSLAYLGGTFVCRRWIVRHGMAGAVGRGALFSLMGGAGVVVVGLAGWAHSPATAWLLLAPQWLFCFGHGVHQPCGQAGAVGPFPQAAGAASALAGFVLAATAFGVGLWLGVALPGGLPAYAMGLGFWAAATSLVAWTLVQRLPRT